MSTGAKHFHNGISLKEWISRVPNELSRDAVGLWQVIPVLRTSFGLEGAELERAVEATIEGLLDRGARLVRCGPKDGPEWVVDDAYTQDRDEVKAKVIEEWVRSDVEPEVDGLWFAILRQ